MSRGATACSVQHLLWQRVQLVSVSPTVNLNEVGTHGAVQPPKLQPGPARSLHSSQMVLLLLLLLSGPFPPLPLGNTRVCHGNIHRHLKSAGIHPSPPPNRRQRSRNGTLTCSSQFLREGRKAPGRVPGNLIVTGPLKTPSMLGLNSYVRAGGLIDVLQLVYFINSLFLLSRHFSNKTRPNVFFRTEVVACSIFFRSCFTSINRM